EVFVHVPETCLSRFLAFGTPMRAALTLRFNVLLRDIDMVPQRSDIAALQEIGPVTVSTAHAACANAETQRRLGCLVHHLCGWPGVESELSVARESLAAASADARFQAALRSCYEKYFPRLPGSGTPRLRWASKFYASNYVRFMGIARERRKHLARVAVYAHARAIILLVPGRNLVNGGIMSIIAIARESEKLRSLHGADVFVCTCPGDPPLLRYSKFPNDRILFDFKAVLDKLGADKDVLVHIPELYTSQFVSCTASLLADRKLRWRFNVMLQNIDMIPQRSVIAQLEEFGPVTVTTAHDAYANIGTQRQLGCPLHHLSAWTSPIEYERRPFVERENIVVVSPDPHERKDGILEQLMGCLPEFRFVLVWNMAYMDYRELIAKAKFSLTFGEGLDAYFSEIILSGGVGIAVYNDRFFTQEFSALPFVYPSWDDLASRLADDIRAANVPDEFARQNELAGRALAINSSAEKFRSNLCSYYQKYFPQLPFSGHVDLVETEKSR
ncbi:MAG TPA: hypothetical protein VF450_15425, partial [Noviherbaspirillum sp.]